MRVEKSIRPPIEICCFILEGDEMEILFEEENTPWHTQGGQLAASDAGDDLLEGRRT
jgi:hypothetical protein